jgi:NAD(P)H-flavin reductase/hemoglobin-like flavoprotein
VDPSALKDSWAIVAKSGDEVPLYFYSHLFLSHPQLREMFPISMSVQRDKLVGALGRIVSSVDTVGEVVPFIQQLGRDHRRFSVVAQHYDAVGASLLATLQHFLGSAWTESLAADWAAAYGLVAKTMVQAAEEAGDRPAWWEADVAAVQRRTIDISVVDLRPRAPFEFRPGQSMAVELPQRPRVWRYFSPANAPREDGSIELHVQLVAGGQVSGAVARLLRSGDTVRLGAPVGDRLTRQPGDQQPLLMVAGGTGLSPMRAVLEQIDREWQADGRAPHVQLLHGARVPWNLYERTLLRRLTQRPWFAYGEVVSDDRSYPGRQGQVGDAAAESRLWRDRRVLVCGSPGMVRQAATALIEAGAPEDSIDYEEFGNDTPPRPTPALAGSEKEHRP